MGSKGLKAVVVLDEGAPGVTYHDKEAFKQATETFRAALREHPVTKPGGGLATFGTNVLVNVINEAGAFPTRNFSEGRFEGAGKISGETMHDTTKARGGKTTHEAGAVMADDLKPAKARILLMLLLQGGVSGQADLQAAFNR